ncbi:MAG TPA: hypothetical protein VFI11_08690, partial [Anaerolineales bacterium]|nr:hypothetical protein [Anaerolineales bacterium]
MRPRGGWARILVPVVLVVAATMVPYLWAWSRSSTGSVFGGFLLNPQDGFSYLAKMRQGFDGSWLFRLPYAADPGPGVFLFTFYLFLGHVSRVLGANPLVVYHAARAIGAVCMFLASRALVEKLVPSPKGKGWAWAMILVGSGFGWMGLPFGLLALDLWVPEAIPVLAAYASAHFPFAIAVLCMAALAISPGYRGRSAILVAGLSGLLLSILQPFAVAVVAAYAVVYLGLDVAAPAENRQGGDRR